MTQVDRWLQVFDGNHNLSEGPYSPPFPRGNAYGGGFNEATPDIIYFEISGDTFAIDDLQFSSVPLPDPTRTMPLMFGLTGVILVSRDSALWAVPQERVYARA